MNPYGILRESDEGQKLVISCTRLDMIQVYLKAFRQARQFPCFPRRTYKPVFTNSNIHLRINSK